MLKVEEKQYHETRRVESKSPMRIQNVTHNEFDNNLDYLLEDLQNSISRPDPVTDTRYNSLNRITSLRPANPITEFSSDDSYSRASADGTKNVKTVKKEVYSYQTSGGGIPYESNRIRNNINELDSLLDDLQQVKQPSENYKTSDGQNYREYSKSKVISGKTVVEKVYPVENVYPETSVTSRSYVSSNTTGDETVATENQYLNEGTYGNIKTRNTVTPSPPLKTGTLSKQTKITNVHSYPIEVIETTTPGMNTEILANLDPNLLPSGNTKVTTTIKTYTYEIPGTVYPSPNTTVETEKYVYSPNQSQSTPSKSFVYNKYENNSLQQNANYTHDAHYRTVENTTNVKSSPSPLPDDRTIIKETVTTRNYQPGPGHTYPDGYGKQTYVYNDNSHYRTVENTTNVKSSPSPLPDDRTIVKETLTARNYQPGSGHTYPDGYGKQTYVYNESTITKSTGPNPNDYRPYQETGPTQLTPSREPHTIIKPVTVYNENTTRTYIDDTRNRPPYNTTYKYSEKYKSDSSSDENKPLLHYPGRFPTDSNDSPPKKLDELMATIGNEPPNSPLNAGFNAHEVELVQQKKVDQLKLQQKEADIKEEQKKIQRTKNVTGPPVYYPPGHEMFITKSESGGGWRAEGAMAKESGKYKYEAESKSSTKVKTGAAVVPLCLPLCCGLPCTIL